MSKKKTANKTLHDPFLLILAASVVILSSSVLLIGSLSRPLSKTKAQTSPPVAGSWTWESTTPLKGQTKKPLKAGDTVVTFGVNNQVAFATDCNSGSTSYALSKTAIEFAPINSTKKACPKASTGDEFLNSLSTVDSYRTQDSDLYLYTPDSVIHLTKAN